MSSISACAQCRQAKVRCDRKYPSCGRCTERKVECVGLTPGVDSIFRNENEVARRNSQRARGEGGNASVLPLVLLPEQAPSMQGPIKSRESEQEEFNSLQELYPWLNERALSSVPEPLKRDLETRAIERFFVNWVLPLGRDGRSPGHMADLPLLYHTAAPDSVLVHAVRTVAFADVRQTFGQDTSFSTRARRSYGMALARLRETVQDEAEMASDYTFAGLLLIDSFETVYLASEFPLGSHGEAIKYILTLRGNSQLFSRSNFSLWSVANHRLQARQILKHEEPDSVQTALLEQLDLSRPDIRICADAMKMTSLCAAADRLIRPQHGVHRHAPSGNLLDMAEMQMQQMQALITAMESWTSSTGPMWQPRLVDAKTMHTRPREYEYTPDHPLAHLYCPKLLAFPDVWLAFIWGFHAACQIIFRETFIEVVEFWIKVQLQDATDEQTRTLRRERAVVEDLAASVIRSFPALMGFTNAVGEDVDLPEQGLMAGRCLALFAMEVIHKAKFPRFEHKNTARAVIRWMSASYALN